MNGKGNYQKPAVLIQQITPTEVGFQQAKSELAARRIAEKGIAASPVVVSKKKKSIKANGKRYAHSIVRKPRSKSSKTKKGTEKKKQTSVVKKKKKRVIRRIDNFS